MADERLEPTETQQAQMAPTPDEAPGVEELKVALSQRDERVQALEKELEGLRQELALALERYRISLVRAMPEAPEEMVRGATVRELDEAYSRARQMVERVRGQLEARQAKERVPAGAPARSTPDMSGLSAREKIAFGLAKR